MLTYSKRRVHPLLTKILVPPPRNAIKCSCFGLCTFKLLSKVKNYLRMSFYWRLNYLQLFMTCHSDSYLVTTFVHCIIWTFKLLSKIQNYLRVPFYWRLNYLQLFMTCYSDSYLVTSFVHWIICTFTLLSKIQNYLPMPFYWRLNYLERFMTCYSDSYLVTTLVQCTIRTFKLLSTTAEAKINIGAHDGFIINSCLTSSF